MVTRVSFGLTVLFFVASAQMNFPNAVWPRRTPAQAGFNGARLQAAMDYGGWLFSGSYCVSVHRDGYLVADLYRQGFTFSDPSVTWSTSKAVMSTLIGIAERNGRLRTSDFVSQYIREWVGTPAERVTIDHLLRHDSGRYYELINDFVIPQFLSDQTAFGVSLRQASPPGTVNQYNQMAFQILQRVFVAATGESIQTASERELFVPLDFAHRRYWMINSVILQVPQAHPLVYGGLYATCTDLARIGHLWLNNGNWRGRQILTPDFVQKALTPQARPYGQSRRYHWGGPPNTRAIGLGNQFVSFNVGNGVVLTRLGDPLSPGFQVGNFIDQVMAALNGFEGHNSTASQPDEPVEIEERQSYLLWRELSKLPTNTSQSEYLRIARETSKRFGFEVPMQMTD